MRRLWRVAAQSKVPTEIKHFGLRRSVLRCVMFKNVVRCSVCARVHDVTELIDVKQLTNGVSTFTCPVRKLPGTYKLENIGTLQIKPAA